VSGTGKKPVGVVRFLGTNCDRDVWQAVEAVGATAKWLWFEDRFSPSEVSALIVPGGFSYGDYLRCGALAAKAPVMDGVREAAAKGLPVLGICNGFQILCESGLLPGALVRNESRKFVDKWVELETVNRTWWSADGSASVMKLPVAHGEGRYYIEPEDFKRIEDQGQVWLKYKVSPNGSLHNIAGLSNKEKNVCALMPHPERAIHAWMGSADGMGIMNSLTRLA
jgi:phosphoribosylformylglycinamidine synthase